MDKLRSCNKAFRKIGQNKRDEFLKELKDILNTKIAKSKKRGSSSKTLLESSTITSGVNSEKKNNCNIRNHSDYEDHKNFVIGNIKILLKGGLTLQKSFI